MSHVRLPDPTRTARALWVVLAVVSVVWLVQGADGPRVTERALAAPSAAPPEPTPTPPPLESYTVYLPRLTQTVALPPRFQTIASPNFSSESATLAAVDLLSPTDGWAVGSYDGHHAALILRWDGVGWTPVPAPALDLTWQDMSDVVAITPHDAWAAFSSVGTLLFHWTGQVWERVIVDLGPGFVPPQFAALHGLAASGPNDVWAVGVVSEDTPQNHTETLILHWDGSRWTRVPSPNPSPDFSLLTDVASVAPTMPGPWAWRPTRRREGRSPSSSTGMVGLGGVPRRLGRYTAVSTPCRA